MAVMGVRALLEHIMIEKVGDQGSIGGNVKAFLAAGFVADANKGTFEKQVMEAGHAAMHRNYRPHMADLNILLDIVEALIASIYVHPHRTEALAKGIPARLDKKGK